MFYFSTKMSHMIKVLITSFSQFVVENIYKNGGKRKEKHTLHGLRVKFKKQNQDLALEILNSKERKLLLIKLFKHILNHVVHHLSTACCITMNKGMNTPQPHFETFSASNLVGIGKVTPNFLPFSSIASM